MHRFLRAIGFSDVKNRSDFEKILGMIMESPTEKRIVQLENKMKFVEMKKDFSEHMGIGIVGEYDEKGFFYLGHFFPYCRGRYLSVKEDICINKRVDTDAYTGMCEDMRFGVSLIFFLQTISDFIQEGKMIEGVARGGAVSMSALSIEGKVILGLQQNEVQLRHSMEESVQRKRLIAEAKKGNQEAIDSLTIEDIDIYAMVSRRIQHEDLYSIVENTFIPYGSESDNYTVIANIMECQEFCNPITGEKLYYMTLSCNEMIFNLCMKQEDLLGVPFPGARFKGNIWMQGMVKGQS